MLVQLTDDHLYAKSFWEVLWCKQLPLSKREIAIASHNMLVVLHCSDFEFAVRNPGSCYGWSSEIESIYTVPWKTLFLGCINNRLLSSRADWPVADLGAGEILFLCMNMDIAEIYLCPEPKGLKISMFCMLHNTRPSLFFSLSFIFVFSLWLLGLNFSKC